MAEMKSFNHAGLAEFLRHALANTYASGQGKLAEPKRPGCSEYEFEQDGWHYHDSYCGGSLSWGQEIVSFDGQKIWSQVYGGGVVPEQRELIGSDLLQGAFATMRKALVEASKSAEFLPRGPKQFSDGDYVYTAEWEGDMEHFRGQERVHHKDTWLHVYDFAGGLVR